VETREQDALKAKCRWFTMNLGGWLITISKAERPEPPLQSTALVHEAYLRLIHQSPLRLIIAHIFSPWHRTSCARFLSTTREATMLLSAVQTA